MEKLAIKFFTVAGLMGQKSLEKTKFNYQIVYTPEDLDKTSSVDTQKAAQQMMYHGVDLILFAGGDGTAINILSAVGETQLCLGIPTGCKIYSGVFGVTPELTAQMILKIIHGAMVDMSKAQVLDIDEEKFRDNRVNTKVYGEMTIPQDGHFTQAVKISGVENEDLATQEIAAWITETIDPDLVYFVASGRTCFTIKEEIGVSGTLLGVDVILNGTCILQDATESDLISLINQYKVDKTRLILSFIGGQGILLGRGNHQVSHKVIEMIPKSQLMVVATKTKIKELNGQPLFIDTGSPALNKTLSGYIEVITGYDERILYPIGNYTS